MTPFPARPFSALGRLRWTVGLVIVAVAITGCTGSPKVIRPTPSPTTAATSATVTPGTSGSATPSVAPAPTHPHTVSFTSAWRWVRPGAADDRDIVGIAQDPTRVYVAVSSDTRGSLYAVSLRTGRTLWSLALPASPTAEPVVVGTHVMIDSLGDTGDTLVGVNAATGRVAWRHPDVEPGTLDAHFAVRIGGALFVADSVGKKAYVTRLDPATGKITARHAANRGNVFTAGTNVLLDDAFHLSSYPLTLKRPNWTVPNAGLGARDFFTDSTIVSTLSDVSGLMTGTDPLSGRRLWRRALGDTTTFTFSAAGPDVVFTNPSCSALCSMTAIAAHTGAVRWKTSDVDQAANYAAPDLDADGLLLCGTSLLSANASSGALYKIVAQPIRAFCAVPLLRTDDQAGTTSPHHVLGATLDDLRSYTTTAADDPPIRTDQKGGWGNVDPKQCQVNPTTTAAGLKAEFGGTWLLTSAEDTGSCYWTRGRTLNGVGLDFTTRPLGSAASAKAYLSPKDPFGGCARPGSLTRGRAGTAPTPGLPAGSALCYATRYYFLGDKAPDNITGVTRARTGRYVAVEVLGLPWGTVTSAASLKRMRALLARLAA